MRNIIEIIQHALTCRSMEAVFTELFHPLSDLAGPVSNRCCMCCCHEGCC